MTVLSRLKKVTSSININLENRAYKIATTVGIIVFSLGVFSSYIYAGSLSSERLRERELYQEQQADKVEDHILKRLATYEELIIVGAAFCKINRNITKSDWQDIYYNLLIPEKAPEILGYGYAEYVTNDNLAKHIEETRKLLAGDYTVTPVSDNKEHAPTKYIEPLNEINARDLGYDMYTDSNRYTAMINAKDSGEPTLSGPVMAIQEQRSPESKQAPSLVIYYPIYEESRVNTGDDRTLLGYSYIIFRVEDIMQKIALNGAESISSFYVQDMEQKDDELIYLSESNTNIGNSEKSNFYERSLDVLSRKWTIGIIAEQPEASSLSDPTNVFIKGVIASLLFSSLLFLVLLKRYSDINRNHSIDLQKSKDELLALASHQLRTPATGVRQYVGMLVQGYFGDLNKEQLAIAKKAYDTNDRQLEIIDQLLYVAKADAGQLVVSFDTVDIAKIVQDVMADYDYVAASKNINLYYKGRKKLLCSGDKRYITMIIENLLSNAIKYSHPDAKVRLELKKVNSNVVLRIKDQGVGILEQDKDKLFQKFTRIDSSLSRSEGGSGLGLYLAKNLAESHGGKIIAKSTGKKGSTFILTLPLKTDTKKKVVQLIV